jgi:hypothetical protein
VTRPARPAAAIYGTLCLVFAYLLLVYPNHGPAPHSAAAPLDATRLIAKRHDAVRDLLSDPESARFRGEFVSLLGASPAVCGWWNARNAAGGYDGFRRFVVGDDVVEIDGVVGTDARGAWRERCGDLPAFAPTRR